MQVELRRIQQEIGITTVFVTHNQEEALTMSDRLAVMNEGQFGQVGPPGDVYDNPDSRFVADFLGTANLFEGVATTVTDEYTTVECDDVNINSKSSTTVDTGDDVSLVVRPERFRFVEQTKGGDTDDNANVFEGEITFTRHLGSSVEFRLETANGYELIVVHRSGLHEHDIGEQVTIAVDADDCRLVSV